MSEPLRLRKPEVLQQQSTSVDANLEKQNTIKRTFAHANSYNLLINFQGVSIEFFGDHTDIFHSY